jgi:integrase
MPVIQDFQTFMAGGGLVCPAGKSKIEWAVADEPGLFVECRQSATAIPVWYLRLKNSAGTNVYKKLGTVRDVNLGQARRLVKQIRAEHVVAVNAEGVSSAAAKAEMTLERFFYDLYLPHAKIHKRSWNKDESLFRVWLSGRFGNSAISAIKRLDVMSFHNEILAGGLSKSQSRHTVVLFRRMLGLAVTWELLEKNVLKGVPLVPLDNFRDTFLSEEETSRLVHVLTTDSNKLVCAILLFLLNTGARKMEAMKAKWSDIELENRLWTVPAANNKSKKSKTLGLAQVSVDLLMSLPSRGKSEYVFPNPETGLPMTTISRVWYRLKRLSNINPQMRIHDTRACLAQRMLKGNASLETVARALGNHPNMAYSRYARFSTQHLLDAADAGSIPMPQLEAPRLQEAANAGSVIVPRVEAKAA